MDHQLVGANRQAHLAVDFLNHRLSLKLGQAVDAGQALDVDHVHAGLQVSDLQLAVAAAEVEDVRSCAAIGLIAPATAAQVIYAIAALKLVVARAAVETVRPGPAP